MTALETLTRSSYGEITRLANQELLNSAKQLIKQAADKNKILCTYNLLSRDRKGRWDGEALHHEIYDITPNGNKVLLCVREVEGTRYGIKTLSKTYYIIACHGKGVKVEEANKAVAAKAAKASGNLIGYAIEVVTGKARLKGQTQEKRIGYKALTTDEDGNIVSVWDQSPWPLGKTRIEKATDDHTGGFYYYRTIDEVLTAARESDIFGEAREHQNLLIARVEVSGREEQISSTGKLCATRIKPIEIIAGVI